VLLLAALLAAEPTPPDDGEVVEVVDRGTEGSASATQLDRTDILAQPGRSADDLMRAMPGLQVSSHGGRGKAYQYLLRGFDAVHGADVSVQVEGVTLNEPSNTHGHGYLDLHLLPVALIRSVTLSPGSFDARSGDFHTAAGVSMALGTTDDGLMVQLGGGTDRSGTARLTWHPAGSAPGNFAHADIDAGRGVTAGRAWRQARVAFGAEHQQGQVTGRLTLLGYDGWFQSPGLVREDDRDQMGFYDAYPNTGGGRSTRALAIGALDWDGGRVRAHVQASAGLRWLDLTQNYTGSWRYPETGDALRQLHRAWSLASRADLWWAPAVAQDRLVLRAGVDVRADLATSREAHVDSAGVAWEGHVDADLQHVNLGGWIDAEARPTRWWTITPGLRVDGLWLGWRSRLDALELPVDDPAWVRATKPAVSPKLTTRLRPHPAVDVVLAYGRGLRSPEARGVVDGAPAPVTTTDTGEVGLAARAGRTLEVTTTAFATFLGDEIVFDHIRARYLSTGASRRLGGEAVLTVRPIDTVQLQAQVTYADGRYLVSGDPIPYAPRWMGSLAVSALELPIGPTVWTSTLRARVLGPRPLPAGFRAVTAVAGDLTLRGTWKRWLLDVDLENAFFNRWRDGQFVFPSRWDDGPRSDLPAAHYTAGEPTALRVAIGRSF
jgi:iron complex outermembrane receptor protein